MSEHQQTPPVDQANDSTPDTTDATGGQVHYLPARRDVNAPGATGKTVVDAELVSEEEYQWLTSERTKAVERYRGYRHDLQVAATVTRRMVTHDTTKTAGRALVRNVLYLPAGIGVVGKRVRDARSNSRYERLLSAAETDKNWDRLQEWEQRAEQAKQRRHERRMDWVGMSGQVAKALVIGLGLLLGLLLVVGVLLAVADRDFSRVLDPLDGFLDLVRTVGWVVALVWGPLVLAAPWITLLYLWNLGRRLGNTPRWAARWTAPTATRSESFAVITEDMLTQALAHCKVTALNQALKRGEALEYLITPRQQGGGTYVQVRLPLGVIAADFLGVKQVELLAGNLGRHKHEVYPQRQPGGDARVLDLWIADQGAMDRPAPPWPLLDDGEFDVFRDRLPLGVTMRGEQVEQGMLHRHMLTGASSKQGKTATVRRDALGLALDPTVELRIADLKGDGDWSMFAPRAHTLIEGSAFEQTEATCDMLEALVNEMQRRYDTKRALGIKGGITRELSRQPGSGFHPIYGIVDECQVLYAEQHPIGGTKDDARAWRAAKRLHDQARAVNIHLWQATQRPDDRTLPVQVREGAHVRVSGYVPNYATAKMVVADAADMGARPQDLRPGKDAGTVVATGEVDDIEQGMAFLIIKGHYVSTQDAYQVIDRAMQIMARHGRNPHAAINPATRDPLTDIATVLGEHRKLTTRDVLHGLVELDRGFYGRWTFKTLSAYLTEHHADPRKSNGDSVVDTDRITAAITERDRNAGGGD